MFESLPLNKIRGKKIVIVADNVDDYPAVITLIKKMEDIKNNYAFSFQIISWEKD